MALPSMNANRPDNLLPVANSAFGGDARPTRGGSAAPVARFGQFPDYSMAFGADRSSVVLPAPAWDRGPGTMLVSDDSESDTPPPEPTPPRPRPRLMFHLNGRHVSLPGSLRELSARSLNETLRAEVELWRRRREVYREKAYLELRHAAGEEVSDEERRQVMGRVCEAERLWQDGHHHLEADDCERIHHAWQNPPAQSGPSPSLAESLEVFRRQRATLNAAPSAAAAMVSPPRVTVSTASPDRSPSIPPLVAISPEIHRSAPNPWSTLERGSSALAARLNDPGHDSETLADAEMTLEHARQQLEEARQALLAAAAQRTSSVGFMNRLQALSSDARAQLGRGRMSEADVARLHRELSSVRERAGVENSRLETHTETVRRISTSIDQHLQQISRFAHRSPLDGASESQGEEADVVADTLASLARLRNRSDEVRNDLERRRREAGLTTLDHIDSVNRRIQRPVVLSGNEGSDNLSASAQIASESGGSGSESLGIRTSSIRAIKKIKSEGEEPKPKGLRPRSFVSLEERLVIGAPLAKGQKKRATGEDATVRVRVLRKRAGLKAR